jgi:hypothetical protein
VDWFLREKNVPFARKCPAGIFEKPTLIFISPHEQREMAAA